MKLRHLLCSSLITGCGLLDHGNDSSTLRMDHSCEVVLDQASATHGDDQSKVVEAVNIEPDCTTRIEFKQNVGD